MHVALVCPYSLDAPGGVATHVMGLATWLGTRGHTATVIAPGTRPRPTEQGVQVHLLGPSRDFRFNGSVAQLAVRRRQVAEAVRMARSADVVHVHEPLTPGAAFAVARAVGNLVVTHHASFEVGSLASWFLRRRAAALRPRESIAVSEAAQETARATTGDGGVVIGNGLLLPAPPPASSGWRGGARPRIGFLGRLDEPRKGFAVFRALADGAAASGLDADFVALGPGRVESGAVRLLGAVDDAGRDDMLRQIDVLVAPNTFGESFGLILVEALAAGCGVVASDIAGFRDVLEAAGVGALFPAGDEEEAMAALRRTLATPPEPQELHEASRQWGWDALGPRVLAVYGTSLARAGRRGAMIPGFGDDLGLAP